MKNLIFAFALLLVSNICLGDTYPKNPNIDILNYAFRMELSDTSDEIKCEATIDVRFLKTGEAWLRLDLIKASESLDKKGMNVMRVAVGDQEMEYTHENDVLLIKLPSASQANQREQYSITYAGTPAAGLKIADNKYGDRTFFSDNWPNKGRNWLPLVDHPYDKATCEFMVTAPSYYQVVSNGLKVEESDLGDGTRLTHWKQSVPIAPWLYVLGVAQFAIQYVDEFDHKSIETWVYYQDREAGFYDFAEPTKQALAFYSEYVGPFSYEKLANIQSNSVGGGMEAASAVLYGDKSVVGDRNKRWRNVVIHEIAHQWFGNAVTEYDWDDVWLSEGFATYFTQLFIAHQYGHDAFTEGMASSKKRIISFNEKNPDYRIIHDNLNDMTKVTSSHTYQKGSWTLHMLRGVVGTDVFWKGIRSYYAKYQNKNATTADFIREMEEASGLELDTFFDQWLYKPGHLICDGSWKYNNKKKEVSMTLDQVQKDGSLFKMPIQVAVYLQGDSAPLIHTVQLNEKSNVFTLPVASAPEKVLLDPDAWVLMESSFVKE